jgi:YidC/Oxa1 family membrane protein insertase
MSTGPVAKTRQFFRELKDFQRLFAEENRNVRTLCFYSERDIYYRYFEGYIDYVLSKSDLDVCYITSDPDDPLFDSGNPRVKVFYIHNLLVATFQRLDARALVMTMPDLDLYHVKRSRNPVKHVYMFHGVGSIHLQYNKKAFDSYDTIFCLGPYDRKELRRAEETYHLPAKELVETGYYWIEKIFRDHQKYPAAGDGSRRILVAPSWHDENILAYCLTELLAALENSTYQVTLRPHPETIKRKWRLVESIQKRIDGRPNLALELDLVSGMSIHQADLLITDWSAICFEYAFGTERPVLFIDTPCKVQNPDYRELGIEPIEFSTRTEIGRALAPRELGTLTATIDELISQREMYRQRIVSCRERTLSCWLMSDRVGGEQLIDLCREAA